LVYFLLNRVLLTSSYYFLVLNYEETTMTNDDNTRKDSLKNLVNRKIHVLGLAGVVGGIILGLILGANKGSQLRLREAARYLAYEHYEPVGNGGALAEIHGHITPERQKMIEAINAVFLVKYMGQAPVRTFAEYRLKTTPNLSDTERRELTDIVERYKPSLLR